MNIENNEWKEELKNILESLPILTWRKISIPEFEDSVDTNIVLDLECNNCKKNRPFKMQLNGNSGGGATGSKYSGVFTSGQKEPKKTKSDSRMVSYYCTACNFSYTYYLEIDIEKQRIRKLGQNPPWEITIDKELINILGENTPYYKKGLICESQGYGIAAFAYYRRVVENVLNDILKKIKEIKILKEDLQNMELIDQALVKQQTEDKLSIIKEIIPDFLRCGGKNPFKILYSELSEGLHNNEDENCLSNAENIRYCLVFIIKTIDSVNFEISNFNNSLKNIQQK